MKIHQTITPQAKSKKPFIRNNGDGQKKTVHRIQKEENKARSFAHSAAYNEQVRNEFSKTKNYFGAPLRKNNDPENIAGQNGIPLPASLVEVFRQNYSIDFSGVKIHAGGLATKICRQYNASALASGNHVYLNSDVFQPGTLSGLSILAHELFHTIEQPAIQTGTEIQLRPITEPTDRNAEKKAALQRAVNIAVGEKGKVNSGAINQDQTRVGWEFLLEYFTTTLGEDKIVKDKSEYKAGKFLEEIIKYVRKGKAQKVRIVDGEHRVVMEDNVDLLPSWCGIFIFWALHKAGIHPPKWEPGKPNFTAADAYRKGEYLPRPGDIVIKNGFNHYAMVVRTDPEVITDTSELKNVKVTTINGNTAGTNHLGGQIQERTDPYSYWDFYINPFFKGVELTPESEYRMDGRLKKTTGQEPSSNAVAGSVPGADLKTNQYQTKLSPLNQDFASGPGATEEIAPAEPTPVNPKQVLEKDEAFKELHGTLEKNAKKEKAHDLPENKAEQAQKTAVSPPNERLSKAKAKKVEKLGLTKPKEFRAIDLKNNILKEVDRLIKEKEEEANRTGEKPKIQKAEINSVRDKNTQDIRNQKKESVGDVEEAHKEKPKEDTIPKKEEAGVVMEDPGNAKKIAGTEKAVAKPIADERITLEEESSRIDNKMAENDVDETQLAESEEEKFTSSLEQKRSSQEEAAKVKEVYRGEEDKLILKDKKQAAYAIHTNVEKIHETRAGQFGHVDEVKKNTKDADEYKRKEIADAIENIYSLSEKSVTEKLNALETAVNLEFDQIITTANGHFKDNVNAGLDDEFTWEWAAKKLDRSDYNRRVRKVFVRESEKYRQELSDALNPLTQKIADTLNSILGEIQAAKDAVVKYVEGLDPALAEIGITSAKGVLEKFTTLENSVNEKQEALTNNLAKKYADGVLSLEAQLKSILDSRKSWLEKALDAIVDAIKEIVNLFIDLKKALERAAEYAKRIIKAPLKFFNILVKGATAGFNNFVKNIGKHLLQGALEWVTGEMSEAGIQLPDKFDFKGILSIVLQVIGISVNNVKEIAKKVIGAKYVNMLEKGVDLGIRGGLKILNIFNIIRKEGISGLWEFIKEQFFDLKERLMEEAKSFIIVTIVETAVVKVVSMLIPGAGFISAVKSLIDFLRTLFAKARQIVNIITGIIDTFGEILAGNVAKVSDMVEKVLAKFLGLAITFLAAILGLGKIGKKINDIIQKKIREPINKALTKIMEGLKAAMTKLGVFKLLDKVDEKIKSGKNWVEAKKEMVKEKAKEGWEKLKTWLSIKKKFKTEDGETHTIYFNKGKTPELMIASNPITFENFIKSIQTDDDPKKENAKKLAAGIAKKIDAEKLKENKNKNATQQEQVQFEEAKGKILMDLFFELAEHAAILFKTFGAPDVEARFGKRDSTSEFATSANILYLNKKFQSNGSAPTSTNTAIYELLNLRRNGASSYYIKGHLLNQKMGGKGDWDNLTPLSRTGNAQHETNIESVGKKFLDSSAVISYDVIPIYNTTTRNAEAKKTISELKKSGDPDFDTKFKIIGAENYTPTELDCSATLMIKKGNKFEKGAAIFNNKKVANIIDRSPDSYDISGQKKLMVYLDVENVPTLRKNLANANFDSVLAEKIITAFKKDRNIRKYETLFSLGSIVVEKEKDKIKDQLILFHR